VTPEDDASRIFERVAKGQSWASFRFARRISGEGWKAEIQGFGGEVRVVNISRVGIALECSQALLPNVRFPLKLSGPMGETLTLFYVLRCWKAQRTLDTTVYYAAGLFAAVLPREDLPDEAPSEESQAP
jgi:hypothetical protein